MTYKYLCICDYGQVRGVAMAQFIHELNNIEDLTGKGKRAKYEALAMGDLISSYETKEMLYKWADYVIDVRKYLPEDIWHNPRHPKLKEKVKKIWEEYTEEHH